MVPVSADQLPAGSVQSLELLCDQRVAGRGRSGGRVAFECFAGDCQRVRSLLSGGGGLVECLPGGSDVAVDDPWAKFGLPGISRQCHWLDTEWFEIQDGGNIRGDGV